MDYRIADSLDQLRNEVNARWPERSTISDGWIGDTAHAATASDHNPNAAGVVCALDITHDPAHGVDVWQLAERFRLFPHPDVKYVIADTFMWSRYEAHGIAPFTWRAYSGADPHTSHVHVSVGVGRDGQSVQPYDDRDSWFSQIVVPQIVVPNEAMEDEGMNLVRNADGSLTLVVIGYEDKIYELTKPAGGGWGPAIEVGDESVRARDPQ